MEEFVYKGKDETGEDISRTVKAEDRFKVYAIAREAGHTVVSVKKVRKFSLSNFFDTKKIERLTSRISTDDLVMMTKNLGSMLKAGLPVSRALSVIERQSSNLKLKEVVTDVRENIQSGSEFHQSLEKHPHVFDDLYVAMVHAGEEGGNLADALEVLGLQMERTSTLKKKIRGAMIYPGIVISIMIIIGILMMIYVIPSITSTFKKLEIDLPLTTQILIGVSEFMVSYTIFVIVGMIVLLAGFIYAIQTYPGKRVMHYIFIKLPIIGEMVKETNSARTSRTLASLLSSGVNVIEALKITEDVVQNVYYKPIIREAAKRVEKGTALSEVFAEKEDLYPVFVGEMIMVGEETGQIAEMLQQLAEYYEAEVEQKTADLSTIIEPILMVVIGGTVGFFALAMIAPIYSISDGI